MNSVLFRAVGSDKENVFQFTDIADLSKQVVATLSTKDRVDLFGYYKAGYKHVAINHVTVFEIADDVEPATDTPVDGTATAKRNTDSHGAVRK